MIRSEPGFFLGLSRAEFFQLVTAAASAAAAIAAAALAAAAIYRERQREAQELRATAGLLAAEIQENMGWLEHQLELYRERPRGEVAMGEVLRVRDVAFRIVGERVGLLPVEVARRVVAIYHRYEDLREWHGKQQEAYDAVFSARAGKTERAEEGFSVVTKMFYDNMGFTVDASLALLPELHQLASRPQGSA